MPRTDRSRDRSADAPAPRRASLTGRAAVLALVLGVLAVSYAYPLRAWYDQHRERAELRAEAERLEAEVGELETQLRLWDDPAYVEAQARERLGYVLPGEIGYVVVDETGEPETELGPDGLPVLIEGEWYSRLWTSIEAADGAQPVNDGEPSAADMAAVSGQLGRPARGVRSIAHRCPCGLPDVVETEPRLPDGTPFPTTFYLTCPRATAAVSTLEASGLMRKMSDRLADDPELAAAYADAHRDYLRRRDAIGDVPEIAGVSAGGMPTRVKCLHALVAHALAAGPGVNPFGDEALEALPPWWEAGPCV
jgi:hypothetical protein